jgi:hypothetical protein
MISRAHIQTINTFPIPEVLTERPSWWSRQRWAQFLQSLLRESRSVRVGDGRLRPVFDFRNARGPYEERFWAIFSGANPAHIPLRFTIKWPRVELTDKAGVSTYRASFKSRIFPDGVASVNLLEYVEFATPVSADTFVDFVRRDVLENGVTRGRRDVTYQQKGRAFSCLVRRSGEMGHPSFVHTVMHVDSFPLLNKRDDWNSIRRLLGLLEHDSLWEGGPPGQYPNLGFRGQLILVGKRASLIQSGRPWDPTTVRTHRCLRNRFAAMVELVSGQRELYSAYCGLIDSLSDRWKRLRGHPIRSLTTTLHPAIRFETILSMMSVLRLGETLAKHPGEEVARWTKWHTNIATRIFPILDSAKAWLGELETSLSDVNGRVSDGTLKILAAVSSGLSNA